MSTSPIIITPRVLRLDSIFAKKIYNIYNKLEKQGTYFQKIVFPKNQGKIVLTFDDYIPYLASEISIDFFVIFHSINGYRNIEQYDYRTQRDILRSMIEKYANILNLHVYGKKYYSYMELFNGSSRSSKDMHALFSGNYNALSKESKNLLSEIQENFNIKRVNRKTRYYLLSGFNRKYSNRWPQIVKFNRTLADMDFQCCSACHNNRMAQIKPNWYRVQEVLRAIINIMFISQYIFSDYCKTRFIPNDFEQWKLLNLADSIEKELEQQFNYLNQVDIGQGIIPGVLAYYYV